MEVKGVKIYLDEDVSPLLAKILKKRGYDVISACEVGITGLSDEEQLLYAIKEEKGHFKSQYKGFFTSP